MVFVIVSDFPRIRHRRLSAESVGRLALGFTGFILNLLIQLTLVWYIFSLLALPAILSAQDLYKEFHEDAFQGTIAQPGLFSKLPPQTRNNLCEFALAQGLFLRIVLFLWITSNVGELRSILTNSSCMSSLPDLPPGLELSKMVHDIQHTETIEFNIVCLNRATKLWLWVLVYIPKVLIAVVLMLSGSIWLMASENIGDLILNSLALAFVVHVDELIASVFFPKCFKDDLNGSAYAVPSHADDNDAEKAANKHSLSYVVCGATMLVSITFVQILIWFQPVIPNYANDVQEICHQHMARRVPWCFWGQTNCFPIS